MKKCFSPVMITALLIAMTSCNNSDQKDTEAATSTSSNDQKETTQSAALPQGMEKIIGEWDLVKVIADNNGDHKIDPAEDAKAITTMQDYLKLNANGTCEYTVAKMEGRYELTAADDGRKKLVMYDKSGSETNRGRYIVSVTDDELVINRILSGSDFEVFKRR